MAGRVITISPQVPVARLERLARVQVERDEIAVMVATTADQRQVRHLRRLAHRLARDDTLDCCLADLGDGGTILTVYLRADRASRRGLGWFGERVGPDVEPEELDFTGSFE
jgi:hypothetical protein